MAGATGAGERPDDPRADGPAGTGNAAGRGGPWTGIGLSGADDDFGLGAGRRHVPQGVAIGADLGGVTLLRLIGEGGMGRVYEGRQRSPDRAVAVKVMRDVFASTATLRRFEHEAAVLARLRHPHIAQIHTFGTWDAAHGPVPYFVMELVDAARPITRFVAETRLPIRDRVRLVRDVCAAVAHGHQRGVIHRDLKPGNILVDAAGEPKVIDFGVARSTDRDRDGGPATIVGDLVGTLGYMSPEQLAGDPDAIDARTDVHALGLVLHEVVTGRLPHDIAGLTPVAAVRMLESRIRPPTAEVERAVAEEGRLPGGDGGSLAAIAARCLELRPADRYATAAELAQELDRWLAGEPVTARPQGPGETLLRLARRHRAWTAAVAVGLAAVVLAMAGIGASWVRAERERRIAEQSRAEADSRGREAERQAAAARAELAVSNVLLAAEARDRGNVAEARRLLDAARGAAAWDRAPIEVAAIAASLDDASATLDGHAGSVTAVAWSADGSRLATGDGAGMVRVERVGRSGRGAGAGVRCDHGGRVWAVAFAPDGRRLASASSDGTVRIWDSTSGAGVATLDGHRGPVYAVDFSADGTRLATAARDGTVRVWETASWTETASLRGDWGTAYAVRFAPRGMLLASGWQDGGLRLWSPGAEAPERTVSGHRDRIFDVAFSPDGALLASASEDGTARLWETDGRSEPLVLRHPVRVNRVAFAAAGRRLVTAAGDAVARIWDVTSGDEVARLRGHGAAVWSVASGPGGDVVATGAADGTARIWDCSSLDLDVAGGARFSTAARVHAVAWSPDGRTIAAGLADGTLEIRTAGPMIVRQRLAAGGGRINGVTFAADGRSVAAACDDGGVRIHAVDGSVPPRTLMAHENRAFCAALSPGGDLLATASEDRTARLWDVAAGTAVGPALEHPRRVYSVVFSADGRTLASACEDRMVRLWSVATGAEIARFAGHEGPVNWVTFSPDSRRLASASSDGTVRLWPVDGAGEPLVLAGPARQIWKVVFSPDGARLAAAAADGTVQVWDATTGRACPVLRGHADQVWGVAFAPDGRRLASGSWDGTLRLWGVSAAEIAAARAAATPDDRPAAAPDAQQAAEWNQFRGPSADGHAAGRPPTEWSEQTHVRWKTAIPGKAWASPVVADGRIWLANATPDGSRLSAIAVDATTGRIERDVTVFEIEKPMFCHDYNSHASPTPVVVDGHVYVHYGSAGSACLDARTGDILWKRQDLPCDHHRGPGSSPIPFDDLLILTFDGFDRQYVTALERATGRTAWSTDRNIDYGTTDGDLKKAYGTPLVIEHAGRLELVSPSAAATVAYDPRTGGELWRVRHGGYNAAARPLFAHGLVIVNTYDGDRLLAIRPGGSGDVTATHVAWRFGKSTPTRPSQVVVGDHLYMVSDNGVFTCLDVRSGAIRWQERRTGRHSAAVVAAGGRIYACDEDGTTSVVEPTPERLTVVGENRLESGCMASPAVVGDDLVIRTKTHLYRIGAGGR
jgi:WD40 repeat protein